MTTDSLFWLASMTKPITTVVRCACTSRGSLLLDDEVSAHLPALADRQVGVVDDGVDPRNCATRAGASPTSESTISCNTRAASSRGSWAPRRCTSSTRKRSGRNDRPRRR